MKISRRLEFWLSLILILVAVAIIYYPTLSHVLRGETYIYYIETAEDTTASALISNWWNHESVREIAPGDTMLFRPLLYITLALEKAYFGADYFLWRLVAMLFHMIAVICLFRLLWKIKPGILATLMTGLFSTSYLALSTLLYEQISTYALFAALILTGFYYLYQGTESGSKKDLIIASICMMVACFFHETGIFITGLFIIYFWWIRKGLGSIWKYWSLSFIGIVLIWLSIYISTKIISPARFWDAEVSYIINWETIPYGLKGTWVLADVWFRRAVLPATFIVEPIRGLLFNSLNITYALSLSISFILNCVAIGGMGVAYFYTKASGITHRFRNPFIMLLFGSMAIFTLVNAMFRTRSHGGSYLVDHNFNMYMWLALLAILAYMFISRGQLSKRFTWIATGALIIFIGLNAPISFSSNLDISKSEGEIREYFHTIDEFVEEHKDEQDLSFNIVPTCEMQEDLEFAYWKSPEGMDNRPTVKTLSNYDNYYSSVPQVLYAEYWDNENPKYVLEYDIEKNELEIK